jgi:hypothetical protein
MTHQHATPDHGVVAGLTTGWHLAMRAPCSCRTKQGTSATLKWRSGLARTCPASVRSSGTVEVNASWLSLQRWEGWSFWLVSPHL